MASRAGRVARLVLLAIGRALWLSLMVLTPLFGFWLASSLAAYHNATQWLSLLVGLLLFPLVPVGWELLYAWRRKRAAASSKKPLPKAILTRLDRLVLRTLIINVLFLGGMMWQARAVACRALAVRGDWMLDSFDGAAANAVRGVLLGIADHLDKRHEDTHDTYGHSDKAPDDVKPPPPEPPKPPVPPTDGTADGTIEPPERTAGSWPLPIEPSPLVGEIPEDDQHTVEAVGSWFAARITDKKELVKALHDYVIARLHYDYDALRLIEARDWEHVPAQTAVAVFDRRAAVCEGYARLMVALGDAAGVEIAYVTGSIRDSQRRLKITDKQAADPWDTTIQEALEGVGHAWNAVKLDGTWYLMDVTWDDPTGSSAQTTYLFTPPKLMVLDHYPEDSKWQLLDSPLSLGDFVRQPLLSPSIGELGLSLVSPTRSQITVDDAATIVIDNPYGAEIDARAVRDGAGKDAEGEDCTVKPGKQTTITCNVADGEWEIRMYGVAKAKVHEGRYMLDYVGSILVNKR